jgi:hypothetical protein
MIDWVTYYRKVDGNSAFKISVTQLLTRLEELAGNDPNQPSRFFILFLANPHRPAVIKARDLNPALNSNAPAAAKVAFPETLIANLWDIICAAPQRFSAIDARPGYTFFGVTVEDWSRAYSLFHYIQNRGKRFMTNPSTQPSTGMVWADLTSGTGAVVPTADGAIDPTQPVADDDETETTVVKQSVYLLTTQAKMELLRTHFGLLDPRKFEMKLLSDVGDEKVVTGEALNKYKMRDNNRVMQYAATESISTAVFTAARFVKGRETKLRNVAPVLDLESQYKFIEMIWEHHVSKEIVPDRYKGPDIERIFKDIAAAHGDFAVDSADPITSGNATAIAINNAVDSNDTGFTAEQFEDEATHGISVDTLKSLPSARTYITSEEVFTAEKLADDFTFLTAMEFLDLSLTQYYATKEDPDPSKRNIVRLREDFDKEKMQFIHLKDMGLNPGQIIGTYNLPSHPLSHPL